MNASNGRFNDNGSGLRILKVWDAEYPWDVRAEKVCRALQARGHHVHMVARNRDGRELREELDECTVHRMKPWSWLGRRFDAALQFPAFFSPRWSGLMARTGRLVGAEVILVRDLPLAPTAIYVGRRLGVPVVLDMAEHYAAMMRDLWDTSTTRFGDLLVRNPRAVEAVERWVMRHVDHTVVVVDESKERLVQNGADASRISVVGNTPPLSRLEEFRQYRSDGFAPDRVGDESRPLRLVYLGLMEEARGVRQTIDAVGELVRSGLDVSLDLIGDGRSLTDFRVRAAEVGLTEPAIRFHGFVEYGKALRLVGEMDAGLIPHFASESWESTIPNKLFDYMSLGLPVIASDVTPVARVLSESEAGVVFRDRDTAHLVEVIRELAENPARRDMGQRGLDAIRNRYHFEQDTVELDRVLSQVVGDRGSRGS